MLPRHHLHAIYYYIGSGGVAAATTTNIVAVRPALAVPRTDELRVQDVPMVRQADIAAAVDRNSAPTERLHVAELSSAQR